MTWEEYTAEMVTVWERLTASTEKFSAEYRDDPNGKRLYEVACRLLEEDSPGTDPHMWTMGTPGVGPTVVGKTKAAVFRGPFQPAWALYANEAYKALRVTGQEEPFAPKR